MCANCGGYGHLYKSCNHPVISYGIICYHVSYDESNKTFVPKFLMVQRKDSLSYVEFIRGKYCPENRAYIMKLFMNMTGDERDRIISNDFDKLWKNMWCKTEEETNKNFTKEYMEAADKYNMLKKGYYLKTDHALINFSLQYILENTHAIYEDTEWGFPKGRRNINEDDVSCALREFKEETGIPDWKGMVTQLVEGHEICAKTAREAFRRADEANDQPTADLATTRMQAHEKTAWMLRSLLK